MGNDRTELMQGVCSWPLKYEKWLDLGVHFFVAVRDIQMLESGSCVLGLRITVTTDSKYIYPQNFLRTR